MKQQVCKLLKRIKSLADRYFPLFILLAVHSAANAQTRAQLQVNNSIGFNNRSGAFRVLLYVPEDTTATTDSGAIAYRSGKLYLKNSSKWLTVGSAHQLNDTTLVIGEDTLTIRGTGRPPQNLQSVMDEGTDAIVPLEIFMMASDELQNSYLTINKEFAHLERQSGNGGGVFNIQSGESTWSKSNVGGSSTSVNHDGNGVNIIANNGAGQTRKMQMNFYNQWFLCDNVFGGSGNAGFMVDELYRIRDTAYKNNATKDSILRTDENGYFELVHPSILSPSLQAVIEKGSEYIGENGLFVNSTDGSNEGYISIDHISFALQTRNPLKTMGLISADDMVSLAYQKRDNTGIAELKLGDGITTIQTNNGEDEAKIVMAPGGLNIRAGLGIGSGSGGTLDMNFDGVNIGYPGSSISLASGIYNRVGAGGTYRGISLSSATRDLFICNNSTNDDLAHSGFAILSNFKIRDTAYKNNVTGDSILTTDPNGNFRMELREGYKVYTALLTQTGSSAPTATILRNTLGATGTWGRNSAGIYTLTVPSAFPANKVAIFAGAESPGPILVDRTDNSTITVTAGSDNALAGKTIEIRVYP